MRWEIGPMNYRTLLGLVIGAAIAAMVGAEIFSRAGIASGTHPTGPPPVDWLHLLVSIVAIFGLAMLASTVYRRAIS